jgi:hypothetical protein
MKTFFGALAMITGAGIFGGDPSKFETFTLHQFPGSIIVGGIVFLVGVCLWLGGALGD